jgi:hypothetical protein
VVFQRKVPRRFSGPIELGEAYFGGEYEAKSDRGSENKVPPVAAVQATVKYQVIAFPLFVLGVYG